MNWYWIWPCWLLALVASFGLLEGLALARGGTTLSHFVWVVSKDWPPFGWLCGVIVGFLAAHFWWTNQGL